MTRFANPDVTGKQLWLLKSEPDAYGFDDLIAEGEGTWDGVRNHTAARNLRTMREGDLAFFYHSNTGKNIVAVAQVSVPGLTDPGDAKWAAVKVKPVAWLKMPVTLATIKATPELAGMDIVRQSRLSVAAVRPEEWALIIDMAGGLVSLS
ncbi:EVE domain-containing protein [Novosphingobium sp.]|uniref:EVE domain-containing protein n=1 Tax=Novosphingobium sp. TaxID=1874826 RepID=UPI003B52A628